MKLRRLDIEKKINPRCFVHSSAFGNSPVYSPISNSPSYMAPKSAAKNQIAPGVYTREFTVNEGDYETPVLGVVLTLKI